MKYLTNLIPEETRHDEVVTPRGISFTLRMCVNNSINMVRRNGKKAKSSIAKEMAKVGGALLATWNEVEEILAKEQKRKPNYCTNGNEKMIIAIDRDGELFPCR
jgi:hypothetical protein